MSRKAASVKAGILGRKVAEKEINIAPMPPAKACVSARCHQRCWNRGDGDDRAMLLIRRGSKVRRTRSH